MPLGCRFMRRTGARQAWKQLAVLVGSGLPGRNCNSMCSTPRMYSKPTVRGHQCPVQQLSRVLKFLGRCIPNLRGALGCEVKEESMGGATLCSEREVSQAQRLRCCHSESCVTGTPAGIVQSCSSSWLAAAGRVSLPGTDAGHAREGSLWGTPSRAVCKPQGGQSVSWGAHAARVVRGRAGTSTEGGSRVHQLAVCTGAIPGWLEACCSCTACWLGLCGRRGTGCRRANRPRDRGRWHKGPSGQEGRRIRLQPGGAAVAWAARVVLRRGL